MSPKRTTAPPAHKRSRPSASSEKGLIAKEKTKKQSVKRRTALDNRFHRTDLTLSCGPPSLATGRAARPLPRITAGQRGAICNGRERQVLLGSREGLQPRANVRRFGSFSVKSARPLLATLIGGAALRVLSGRGGFGYYGLGTRIDNLASRQQFTLHLNKNALIRNGFNSWNLAR